MNYEQQQINEARKRFLLWLWVTVFSVAIVLGWYFTFRATARQVAESPVTPSSAEQFKNFQKQFQETLIEARKTWEVMKKYETKANR